MKTLTIIFLYKKKSKERTKSIEKKGNSLNKNNQFPFLRDGTLEEEVERTKRRTESQLSINKEMSFNELLSFIHPSRLLFLATAFESNRTESSF